MISNNIKYEGHTFRTEVGTVLLTIFAIVLMAGTGVAMAIADGSSPANNMNATIANTRTELITGQPTLVNIQLDLESEGNQAAIYNILNEIEKRNWRITVYVTGEFALNYPDVIKEIRHRGHQIAIKGEQLAENITNLSYNEQSDILGKTIETVSGILGQNQNISHYKLQNSIVTYSDLETTLMALKNHGINSITGSFEVSESSKCSYCITF